MSKQKSTSLLVPISVLVLLASTVLYMFYTDSVPADLSVSGRTNQTSFVPTGVSVSYDSDSRPYFYSNGSSGFYFTTKDGINYINSDGRSKWNYVFNLSQPVVKTAGDVIAVSEIKGRSVHVFNASGKLYSLDFDQPVLYFSVNRIGYLVVQLKKDTDYQTKVYDVTGDLVFEYRHYVDNEYPITSDISKDGKIIVSNILEVGGLHMTSSLSFSYTYGNSSTAFSAKNKDNQLITVTGFLDNNNVISVSDTEISAFITGENNYLRELETVPLNNKLSYFEFMGDKGFAVVLGQGLLNKASESENTVKIFNSSAVEIGRFDLSKKVTYFHADTDALLIGAYSSYYAVSNKGNLLWEYTAPNDLKQMIFLGNTDTVLMVSNTEAGVYKRSRNASTATATPGEDVLSEGSGL